MQTTSELYNSILSKPYDVETKIDIYTSDGKALVGSYGEGVLVSCTTTGKLFSSPSVGAAVGREIDVKMLMPTETLPRMAMLKLFVRIKYGTDVSEWIQKGVYFIDTRSTDKLTDVLTIHGYDAMLKTEQLYCGSGDVGQWPRTMVAVVNDICAKIGVTLDSRTTISSEYVCQIDTTLSMRKYLSYIAVAHGGNWIMTDTGELRLIGLADVSHEIDYPTKKYKRELLYLESNRSQWIDTGILATTTTDFEVTAAITETAQTAWIVGAPTWIGVHKRAGTVAVTQTSSGHTYNNVDINEVFTIGLVGDKAYFNGAETNTLTRRNSTMTLFLFAYHHENDIGSIQSAVRMYSFKIWDNGTLIRDFIPVLDMDDVPCMYDKVTDKLFYNQGQGEFSYGEVVSSDV